MSGTQFASTRPEVQAGKQDRAVPSTRMSSSLGLLIALFLLALVLPAGASAAECTNTWTGAAEGSWGTGGNWSAKHVPTSTEVACIGSGKTVNITSGTRQVKMLQGEGTLTITESSLKITATAEASGIKNLTLGSSGVLTGAATLKVSNSLSWIGGTMSGAGSTVLESGGSATIETATLSERTLVNEGTVTFPASYFVVSNGATVKNTGTLNANSTSVSGITTEGKRPNTIINTGTFRKTAGTETTVVNVGFENKAIVNGEKGTLEFLNSAVTLASGSELKGTNYLKGATISGASFTAPSGTVTLRESTLTMASGKTAKIANLTGEYYGTIGGAGTLEVSNSLSWDSADYMTGKGSTVVLSGASGTIGNGASISERTLVNEGTMTYSYGWIEMYNGATFENAGTFNANSESVSGIVVEGEGAAPLIVNTGTFRKTAGEETTLVGVEFDNEGIVHTASGQLRFSRGGSSTGGEWSAGEGSSIGFTGESPFKFTGGGLSGAIEVDTASVAEEGLENTNLSLTVTTSKSPYTATFSVEKGTMDAKEVSLTDYGTLANAGTVEVSDSLTIAAGALTGTGSTILQSGGTGNLEAGARLYEGTLVNEGTMTYSYGYIEMYNGATFENAGTFNANSESVSGIVVEGEGAAPLIVNTGTFRKTAGEETTLVHVDFENLGAIDEGPGHIKIEHPVMRPASNHFDNECESGDPVNCATGNFTETQTDFAIGGRGVGLDLTRTYSAQAAATAGSPGAFGYGWSNSFGDHLVVEGETATVVEGSGNTVPFTKSGESSFKAPAWSQDTLSGNAEAGYTLILPEQTKYAFSGAGKLESVTDRNGNKTTLAYTEAGKLKTIADPVSRKITLTYNEAGLVESAKDPMGHEVKYTYESKDLKTVTLPGETEPNWQFEYDESHRITKVTNGLGGETTNEYDGSSRVISQTDPTENTLTFDYEPFHTTITNEATGSVTDERFTSNNEPFSITRGYGTAYATTDSFSYNVAGQLKTKIDGNGHKTTYSYDADGNRTKMVNAAGDTAKWTYNETHDVLTATNPSGEKTTIVRDGNGNPETISRPAPAEKTQTTSYEVGSHGELKSKTDPLKRTWHYEYNSQGDRKAETDPEGDKRTWVYNEDSQLTSMVSPRGNAEGAEPSKYTTTIERDAQGRAEEVIDPLKHATTYVYDADGSVEAETDPNGDTTKYAYDPADQEIEVEKPNGNVSKTEYDGAGQMISQTDGNEHTTTYVRNVLEQPIEVIDPLGRKTIKEYDAAGNLKILTDPAERETTYAYDPANRLEEVSYSDGITPTATFEYDPDGNLVHMSDGTGETSYSYDQLDRLEESKDGHGDVVGYKYDLANQQTTITYPNGKSVSRTFDNAGRLESIKDWLEHTTTFAYDLDSDLKSTTFPPGTGNVDNYGYDAADQMNEAKLKKGAETLASLAYTRDKDGQVETTTSNGLPGPEELSYTYDENRRLTKAGAGSYDYDAADNMTEAPGTTNAYDEANQLETGTNVTYSFDELGERTATTPASGPATTYGYDQAGNLISVKRPEEGEVTKINTTYVYSGNDTRMTQTISGTTSYLTWDMSANLPLILNDGQNSYVYGPSGLPVEQISSGETPTYYHHDQLGSTRMLTNSSGEAKGTFSYAPYGTLVGSTGSQTTPLGYAGQYTDVSTGLQYLRARYYDPATGQFITRDPLAALTRAPYFYGNDSPLNAIDPSGLGPCLLGFVACDESDEPCDSPLSTGPAMVLCAVPDEAAPAVVNASAGVGDELLTPPISGLGPIPNIEPGPWARDQMGVNNVDTCSTAYEAGGLFGFLAKLVRGGLTVRSLSKKFAGPWQQMSRDLAEKFVHVPLP